MARKSYAEFLEAIRKAESSNRYTIENPYGFLGAYQLGEEALIDAGFYTSDGTKSNDWVGKWTRKAQDMEINSKADFLGAKVDEKGNILHTKVTVGKKKKTITKIAEDPSKIDQAKAAQDAAVRAYYNKVWGYICANQLDVKYVGETINDVKITESALLAGYHLVGLGTKDEHSKKRKGLWLYLDTNGKIDPMDANKKKVSEYIKQFNDYDVPFKKRINIQVPQASNRMNRQNHNDPVTKPSGVSPPPNDGPKSIKDRWLLDRMLDSITNRWSKQM